MDGWLTDSSLVLLLQISLYVAWQFSTRTNFCRFVELLSEELYIECNGFAQIFYIFLK